MSRRLFLPTDGISRSSPRVAQPYPPKRPQKSSPLRQVSSGTSARLMYCSHVLQDLKREMKHGTPATSVAGVYFYGHLKRRRIGRSELQPLRFVGQRIFVAIGAIEQKDAFFL